LLTASSRSTPCTAKKTFEIARETGNDLIVQVKDNQPSLLRRLEDIAATTAPVAIDEIARKTAALRSTSPDQRSTKPNGRRWSPPSCASNAKP
jgi:hypothetical protein